MRVLIVAAGLLVASSVYAQEPITLRGMGSFHIGGRIA